MTERITPKETLAHRDQLKTIRMLILFFMTCLLVSGMTAIPLQWELSILDRLAITAGIPTRWPSLALWIGRVNTGLREAYGQFPFLAYGTDWLAFGHVAIALAFIGPLKDPLKNLWVIEFGLLACALVIPWALVFGPLRGIPLFWRLIDCSFGVFGWVILWICRKEIIKLQAGRF